VVRTALHDSILSPATLQPSFKTKNFSVLLLCRPFLLSSTQICIANPKYNDLTDYGSAPLASSPLYFFSVQVRGETRLVDPDTHGSALFWEA
jgi:hypothetical protein